MSEAKTAIDRAANICRVGVEMPRRERNNFSV
jgi:hypothetical protein